MNPKLMIGLGSVLVFILAFVIMGVIKKDNIIQTNKLEATVLSVENGSLTVQDNHHVIYTFHNESIKVENGESIILEYTGLLDKNKTIQDGEVIGYETKTVSTDQNGIPVNWKDNGIFSSYYILAYNRLKKLSLDEKIGQILLGRYSDSRAIGDVEKYQFSGFVFFEKDFKNKTRDQIATMINELQKTAYIPLLTAVDEEGGKVVRVSSNPKLRSEKFKSPQELYQEGGFDLIRRNTKEKSALLKELGLNLNLAPVVDVATNPSDYMYDRTLQEDVSSTATYAKTVITASKGTGVSYTLKHFPGYGNNSDTHTGSSTDTRTLDELKTNDLPPFKAGIEAGAEAVLVSHNTVNSIDPNNPASLSSNVHNLLRNELGFTGIIISDDLAMGAITGIDNATVKAVLAGNDLIITTDYENSISEMKTALSNGTMSENQIDKLAFRVLAWKYYKGLMIENDK